jgi:hypothetical protein
MAKNYQLIQAQTLTSTAASVTFSNIPQNFTDLKLVMSARTDASSYQADNIKVAFNGGSYSTSSTINIYGNGTSAAAETNPGSLLQIAGANGANSTASTFGNSETYIPNYTSSNNKPISAESVTENNATGAVLWLTSSLFTSSSAITSMTLAPRLGSNFVANSTFMLYGIGGTRATGGTITSDGNYTYHTFTSTSTFTPLEKIKNAEVLLVAGGGGGGGGTFTNANSGGGGGAGGVIAYTGNTFYAGTSYTAVVGAGGTGGSTSVGIGSQGGSSTFAALSAVGGGGGGAEVSGGEGGTTGGSGGGADSKSTQAGSAGTAGQGFAGGSTAGSNGAAAGGGGAGGIGVNATSGSFDAGAPGGIGTTVYNNWHFATSTGILSDGTYYIAGGGGGGSYRSFGGPGGLGGGGTGGQSTNDNDTAGTANTGGGGGGSANQGAGRAGSAGGSGLIIIRYPSI